MPFNSKDALQHVYEDVIEPAVSEAGFECRRSDTSEQAGGVPDQIIRTINDAEVIIADMTQSNPNVAYEIGLGHGLTKPVIILTQKMGDVPFDLQSYRTIDYADTIRGGKKLKERIIQALTETTLSTEEATNPVRAVLPNLPDAARVEELTNKIETLDEERNGLRQENLAMSESVAELQNEQHRSDNEITRLTAELVKAEKANEYLKGLQEGANSLFAQLGGVKLVERALRKAEEQGASDTVSLPVRGPDGTQKKELTFKRVPKSKRVKLPPRK